MSTRNKLESVITELKTVVEKNNVISEAHWKELERLSLIKRIHELQVIREEKLLKLCTWSLATYSAKVFLNAEEYSDDVKVLALSALTETDYHCEFYFSSTPKHEITLHYDDGTIRIAFDDPTDVPAFVKEYELTVNVDRMNDEIVKYAKLANDLKNIRDLVRC